MTKRKKFLSKANKDKTRSTSEIRIDDMQLLKSAHEHDKLRITSLKHKLDRANRKSMRHMVRILIRMRIFLAATRILTVLLRRLERLLL